MKKVLFALAAMIALAYDCGGVWKTFRHGHDDGRRWEAHTH